MLLLGTSRVVWDWVGNGMEWNGMEWTEWKVIIRNGVKGKMVRGYGVEEKEDVTECSKKGHKQRKRSSAVQGKVR